MSLVFVCDESGAKGYADQPERFPGEVGVIAGYMLPANRLDAVAADLDAICLPFRRAGRKLHVTELGPDAERLRAAVYGYFLRHDIPFAYEATHAQGFFDFHRGKPGADRESLHAEVALGAFGKAVVFAAETEQEHSIRVITDRVDSKLMSGFFEAFDLLLSDDPVIEMYTRRDPDPAKRTKGWVSSQVAWPEGFDAASFRVGGYSVESDPTESGLTVAADVLVGGLEYHFRTRRGVRFAGPLNRVGALAGHPLERLCYGLAGPDDHPGNGDSLYRHPVEAARWRVNDLLPLRTVPDARDELAEIVRGRAYMIHVARRGQAEGRDDDWHQAREELGIPPDLWL